MTGATHNSPLTIWRLCLFNSNITKEAKVLLLPLRDSIYYRRMLAEGRKDLHLLSLKLRVDTRLI